MTEEAIVFWEEVDLAVHLLAPVAFKGNLRRVGPLGPLVITSGPIWSNSWEMGGVRMGMGGGEKAGRQVQRNLFSPISYFKRLNLQKS
jgi:hypothetical protein